MRFKSFVLFVFSAFSLLALMLHSELESYLKEKYSVNVPGHYLSEAKISIDNLFERIKNTLSPSDKNIPLSNTPQDLALTPTLKPAEEPIKTLAETSQKVVHERITSPLAKSKASAPQDAKVDSKTSSKNAPIKSKNYKSDKTAQEQLKEDPKIISNIKSLKKLAIIKGSHIYAKKRAHFLVIGDLKLVNRTLKKVGIKVTQMSDLESITPHFNAIVIMPDSKIANSIPQEYAAWAKDYSEKTSQILALNIPTIWLRAPNRTQDPRVRLLNELSDSIISRYSNAVFISSKQESITSVSKNFLNRLIIVGDKVDFDSIFEEVIL